MAKKKPLIKRSKALRVFMVVNALVFFFVALAFGREYVSRVQIEREIRQLENERAQLEQDQLHTLQLIDTLSSEYYLEKEARKKHGLAKEGEKMIVVQEQGNGEEADEALKTLSASSVPYPKKWFYYFFDKQEYHALNQD